MCSGSHYFVYTYSENNKTLFSVAIMQSIYSACSNVLQREAASFTYSCSEDTKLDSEFFFFAFQAAASFTKASISFEIALMC